MIHGTIIIERERPENHGSRCSLKPAHERRAGNSRPAEDRRRAHQAQPRTRGSSPGAAPIPTTGRCRRRRTWRSVAASNRTRASAPSIARQRAPRRASSPCSRRRIGATAVKPLVATSRMANYYATPILPLARDKVRHVGEPVAGVVADNRYQAEDAAALIAIDYEPLPLVVDPEQAVRAGAPLLHDEAGTNVIVSREFKRGDVEAASASAAVRVTGRFRMHRKSPVAIEPRCLSRRIRAGRDALTLHSATQVPGIIRDALSSALDMPRRPAPRHRGRRRRRLRRQGLALRRGNFRLRGGAAAATPGEMDRRPPGRPGRRQPGLRRNRRRRTGARRRRPHSRLAGRRHRRRRRLFDLSVDRGARAGAGREFSARPLSRAKLSRPGAARWRPRRRRPDPIAASAGRSRPSSWNG